MKRLLASRRARFTTRTDVRIFVHLLVAICPLLVFTGSPGSALAQPSFVNWTHLSSADGELPIPPANTGQPGLRVLDLDQDGQTDYVLELWGAPALIWYRQQGTNFQTYVIESQTIKLTHGERFKDIDGDGDTDLLFGEAGGSAMYWWENPYPVYHPDTNWVRRIIRDAGNSFYHDNIWGDFDGDGDDELFSWNQFGFELLLFEIPNDPRTAGTWPVSQVFSWEGNALSYRGTDAVDINLDGKIDLVGGGGWFEHLGGTNYLRHPIDEAYSYSQAKAGQLIPGGRPEVVFLYENAVGPLNFYEWSGSAWEPQTLLPRIERSHTLQLGDVNGDGNLDIVVAEMGEGFQPPPAPPDNPAARLLVFYGDGAGNFTQQEVFVGQGLLEGQLADIDDDGDLDIVAKPHLHNVPRMDMWINEGPSPAITPVAGTYPGHVTVGLSSEVGDAIYYTLDGTPPDTNAQVFTSPLTVNSNTTVMAVSGSGGALIGSPSVSSFAVTPDVLPPSIRAVDAVGDGTQVCISFSEPVEVATAEVASNYSVDQGVTVISASLDANLRAVVLSTTALQPNVSYTLAISNVRDRALPANVVLPASEWLFEFRSIPTAGLSVWFEAGRGAIPVGTTLSRWQDISGSDRHASQAAGFAEPAWLASGVNGRPVVRFDGVNDHLTFTQGINGLTGMTLFLVAANTRNQDGGSSQAENAALFWNETQPWGALYLSPFQSSVNFRFGTTQSGNRMVYNRPVSVGDDFTLSTAVKEGGTDSLYVNRQLAVSEAGKLSTIAGCRSIGNLGRGYDDDRFFAGDIAEVLVYDRALAASERVAVETYLDNKYAITIPVAPQITSQPASLSVEEPGAASFQVAASGSEPLFYQWRRSGIPILAATNTSYTLESTAQATDDGAQFDVVVSNSVGVATSQVAVLTVTIPTPQPPQVNAQPMSLTVIEPGPATFSVGASGSQPLSYGWRRDGNFIIGETNPTYLLSETSVAADDGAVFDVVITNSLGSVTSQLALLTVTEPPAFPQGGLSVWLRADAISETNGSAVGQWTDLSGNNRHAGQATAAARPLLTEAAVNGLPAVRFDGLDDHLTFTMPVTGLTGMSLFLVTSSTREAGVNPAANAALFWNETAFWGTVHLSPFQSSVHLRFGTAQSGNQIIYSRPASVSNLFTLTAAIKDGTNDLLRVNGTTVVSEGDKWVAIAACDDVGNLGRGFDNDTYFGGDIAEVLVYDRALSDVEQAAVEQYLEGKYSLTIPAPPQITVQPADVTVVEPQAAGFSVSATGTAPLAYEWRRDGVAIPGATNSSYTLGSTTATTDDGAGFEVMVSNAFGSVTSQVATLTVIVPQPPQITVQPADVTVVEPQAAGFSVSATGTAPLTYEWRRDGAVIPGATNSSYTLGTTSATIDDGAQFVVIISNPYGVATSSVVELTVTAIPLSGLSLWLSADDAGGTNGAAVSQWTDQSGNGRDAEQYILPSQPTVVPHLTSGKPVVRFDGVDDYLTFNLPVNGLTGMSVFVVSANTQDQDGGPLQAAQAAIFWNETLPWGTVYLSPFQETVNLRFGTGQSGNLVQYSRPEPVGDSLTVTAGIKNGTTDSLYVDGALVLSQGSKFTTIAGCENTGNLGRGFDDNTFFAGDIAEILVYDRALSAAEVSTVLHYLDRKYGLAVRPRLMILESGPLGFTLSWEGGGTLQSASAPFGPWLGLTNTSPHYVPFSTIDRRFFRVLHE